MGLIQPHELSLNCSPAFIPHTISEFLGQVSMIENVKERVLRFDEYITSLDDEMRKIDAFKRELPLSMFLLNDAIAAVKEKANQCRKLIAEPVLEEFMPLKKACDEEENDKKVEVVRQESNDENNKERMDWLSSVQLWSSDQREPEAVKRVEEEVNNVMSSGPFKPSQSVGRAFVPFKGCPGFPFVSVRKEEKKDSAELPGLSLCTPGIRIPMDDVVSNESSSKAVSSRSSSRVGLASPASNVQPSLLGGAQSQQQQQQTARKQRRCWSPELHRRFVDALQQLGGSQVATPKQIRELMPVDGLTNDEVKSHLQKYRLHTRRLSASSTPATVTQCPLLLWTSQDQSGESSKQSHSLSGSPQDPLQFGGDSVEDEDDDRSESHSWRSHVHSSQKKNNV